MNKKSFNTDGESGSDGWADPFRKLWIVVLLDGCARARWSIKFGVDVSRTASYCDLKTSKVHTAPYMWRLFTYWSCCSVERAWLNRQSIGFNSFASLCEMFGYDPEKMRERVLCKPVGFHEGKETVFETIDFKLATKKMKHPTRRSKEYGSIHREIEK